MADISQQILKLKNEITGQDISLLEKEKFEYELKEAIKERAKIPAIFMKFKFYEKHRISKTLIVNQFDEEDLDDNDPICDSIPTTFLQEFTISRTNITNNADVDDSVHETDITDDSIVMDVLNNLDEDRVLTTITADNENDIIESEMKVEIQEEEEELTKQFSHDESNENSVGSDSLCKIAGFDIIRGPFSSENHSSATASASSQENQTFELKNRLSCTKYKKEKNGKVMFNCSSYIHDIK